MLGSSLTLYQKSSVMFFVLDKPQTEFPEQRIALETQRHHWKPKDLTEFLWYIVSIPSQNSFKYWLGMKSLWSSINRWPEKNFCSSHVDYIPQIHTILISSAHFYSRVYISEYFFCHGARMAHWAMRPTAEFTSTCNTSGEVNKSRSSMTILIMIYLSIAVQVLSLNTIRISNAGYNCSYFLFQLEIKQHILKFPPYNCWLYNQS